MKYFEKLSSKDIRSRVAQVINSNLGIPVSSISDNTLLKDLKMDELDKVELQYCLENEFKLPLPDKDFYKFKTIGNSIKYISEKQKG